MYGILYLVPVPIGDGDPIDELAPRVIRTLLPLRDYIVENERTARRFLARVLPQEDLDASTMMRLDEHTRPEEVHALLEPLMAGRDTAMLSEAGSPCVADPGTALVAAASLAGIRSVPLPGPSSILMAVMASGLGGQRFSFRGYLPPDGPGRENALRDLESSSARNGSTEVFIETPYRNDAVVASAARVLLPDTVFCAATALSTPQERIVRMPASRWKSGTPHIGKLPTVFLLSSARALNDSMPRKPRNA